MKTVFEGVKAVLDKVTEEAMGKITILAEGLYGIMDDDKRFS